MDETKLAQAEELVKTGDKVGAMRILAQIVEAEPQNLKAWSLLVRCFSDKEQQIKVLEKCLSFNPGNERVQAALDKLKSTTLHPASRTKQERGSLSQVIAPGGEIEIRKERMHWIIFVPSTTLLIFGFLIWWITYGVFKGKSDIFTIGICVGPIIVILAIVFIAQLIYLYFSQELILTNKRVVVKKGLLSRYSFEILLEKVESIGVKQSLLGRILKYGSILILGTGRARQSFVGMKDPAGFREMLLNEAERAREKLR